MEPTPYKPSKAEQDANVAKLRAEAEKLDAEAFAARQEGVKFAAEAQEASARAREAALKAAKAEDDDRARRAADEFHHIYRFGEPVTSATVRKCMGKLTEWARLDPDCEIEVVFSSPGGEVFAGMELFDFLRGLNLTGHRITTGSLGMAASMAGILLQAGDHRWMAKEAWVLIHRISSIALGSTYEIEDEVKFLKRIEKRVIDIFVDRSEGKLTPNKIKRNWERKDWWLSSNECETLGLVDEVRG